MIKPEDFVSNMTPENQIDLLSKFLVENFENQIGKGQSPHGEGAIEMAVRLLANESFLLKGCPRCNRSWVIHNCPKQ